MRLHVNSLYPGMTKFSRFVASENHVSVIEIMSGFKLCFVIFASDEKVCTHGPNIYQNDSKILGHPFITKTVLWRNFREWYNLKTNPTNKLNDFNVPQFPENVPKLGIILTSKTFFRSGFYYLFFTIRAW